GHGQTLGKTLFKLRVLSFEDESGELSFMEAFMRTLGYTTCYVTAMVNPLLPFLLFSIPVFKKNKSGIPDIFSQTEVVTEVEYQNLLQKQQEEARSREEQDVQDEDHQLELFAS
ncbi:MAG: RDD family protein, partial [Halobacteriovoraceae bacterium]|nr:RDD family protein [Halobacteriovoraceae bacterium]